MPDRGGRKPGLSGGWKGVSGGRDGALFIAARGLDKLKKKEPPWKGVDAEEEENAHHHQRVVRASSAPMMARKAQSAAAPQQVHTAAPPPVAPPATRVDTWAYDGCRPGEKKNTVDRVTIHVHDEVNNISRNFMCRRETLLREMRYFRTYLSDDCSLEDLDISVHCDVSIFKWLMEYIHADVARPDTVPQPDPTIAVSILISSDFLQMSRLVEESLSYVMTHVQEIIKLPIDLDCINKKLIARLAGLFSLEELDKVRDRKDKLVGALFLHKLQSILTTRSNTGEPVNVLYRCSLCGKLFTESQKSWFSCPRSSPLVTFNGESISRHVVDPRWDIAQYLAKQRQKRLSWKEIFWRVWSLTHDDVCKVCGRHFSIAEIGHCSYHLSLPAFEVGSHTGVYPCCNMEVKRFEGAVARGTGCCTRYHVLTNQEQKELVMTVVAKHSDVLIPWGGKEVPEGANSSYAASQHNSDDESDSCSTSSEGTFGPEWRKRSRWSPNAHHPVVFTTGDSLRQSLLGSGKSQAAVQPVKQPPQQPPVPTQKKKRKRKFAKPEPAVNPGPSHEWWQRLGPKAKAAYQTDLQREDDAKRMATLLCSIEKHRADPDKEKAPQKPEQRPPAPKRPQAQKRTMSAKR